MSSTCFRQPVSSSGAGRVRPTLLTTASLHQRWLATLSRPGLFPEGGLIVMLPGDNDKMRTRLLGVYFDLRSRGVTVRLVDQKGNSEPRPQD